MLSHVLLNPRIREKHITCQLFESTLKSISLIHRSPNSFPPQYCLQEIKQMEHGKDRSGEHPEPPVTDIEFCHTNCNDPSASSKDMRAVRARAQSRKAHQDSPLKIRRLDSPISITARDRLLLDSDDENLMREDRKPRNKM
jgi:hypothetical protein